MIRKDRATAVILLSCCGFLCRGQEQQTAPSAATVQTKVVKGVSFSAKVVTESNQTLADGNRIVRKSIASIARDSEGRTRREQNLPNAGLTSVVFIQDPAAGVYYVLDARSRAARKITVPSPVETNATVDRASQANPTDIKSESLGTQIIEGLQTEGTRITRTLAAGQAGNERSLEIVSETWYSTELQTIVMRRTTDPRLGETVYRLTDIQRDEPLHSLFEVPAEYTVSAPSASPR